MTIPTGPMQLLKAEPLDVIEDFENGLSADGGEWTNWERLSVHDHGGGLLGAPITITAAMIPDGSITAGKLDPSVLAPYALTDGSKPFSGLVTMLADAVVRDALHFGEQGSAAAADASLTRTGPAALTLTGGLAATGAIAAATTLQAGVAGSGTGGTVRLVDDGGTVRYLAGIPGAVGARDYLVYDVPAAQARLTVSSAGAVSLSGGAGTSLVRANSDGNVHVQTPANQFLLPLVDAGTNLGHPTFRWNTVFAFTGTISTSTAAAKTGITPLDPVACLQAVKDVAWFDFGYAPPAPPGVPAAREGEAPEATQARTVAAQTAYATALAATAPARHQRGFVFPDAQPRAGDPPLPPVPALFGLEDRQSTTPQADLATVACGLQEHLRHFEALAARVAALEGAP